MIVYHGSYTATAQQGFTQAFRGSMPAKTFVRICKKTVLKINFNKNFI